MARNPCICNVLLIRLLLVKKGLLDIHSIDSLEQTKTSLLLYTPPHYIRDVNNLCPPVL